MRKRAWICAVVVLCGSPALGAEIWASQFDVDGDTDGVVDIYDLNLNKVMISGPTGGRLTILQHDEIPGTVPPAGYPYLPDEATETTVNGKVFYVHDDTYYQPFSRGGDTIYMVVEDPRRDLDGGPGSDPAPRQL